MATLCCTNHKDLRWSCKDIAITDGKYNGQRNIFYHGRLRADEFEDALYPECKCPMSLLIVVTEQPNDLQTG